MDRTSFRIYCAGPLFNPKEREEMAAIAAVLEEAGYLVFLPQRDGLEFARLFAPLVEQGLSPNQAVRMLNVAIFSLDVFQATACHGLILNMNGRVPDEGAMVEAGIAWSQDKAIVIFNSDDRSLISGNRNPLVMGLGDFDFVDQYEQIPHMFDRKFVDIDPHALFPPPSRFRTTKTKGQAIRDCLTSRTSTRDITQLLIELFGGEICPNSSDPRLNSLQANTRP